MTVSFVATILYLEAVEVVGSLLIVGHITAPLRRIQTMSKP